jgi:hypothetical protein
VGHLLALHEERPDSYVFRGKKRHFTYWKNHSLPVVIVLHNPETNLTIWQKFDLSKVKVHKEGWSIEIPKANILDASAREELMKGVSDASVVRRLLLTLDYPLIKKVSACETFFEIDRHVQETPMTWVTNIYFGDFKGKRDATVTMEHEATDIPEFMADVWPWLAFDFNGQHDVLPGDIVRSRLNVHLSELGKSYMAVEQYCEQGADEHLVEDPGVDGEWDDEEEMEENFQRNMERDD